MNTGRKFVAIGIASVAACFTVALLVSNWTWYQDPDRIEAHLLAETPLGTSEEAVFARLKANGVEPTPVWRGEVRPNTSFPPTTVAGSSFAHVAIAEYRIIFTTTVEAFYVFDADRRLVDIAVRKTTDAL